MWKYAAIVAVTIVILALWVRPANGHAGKAFGAEFATFTVRK